VGKRIVRMTVTKSPVVRRVMVASFGSGIIPEGSGRECSGIC